MKVNGKLANLRAAGLPLLVLAIPGLSGIVFRTSGEGP